jgi:glucans biosynthesis protein
MGHHKRHTSPMLESPRCGATTRSGAVCLAPAVQGKTRCRMHGGAKGSGAPFGNRNALKDGLHTHEAIEDRKALRVLIRRSRKLLDDLE